MDPVKEAFSKIKREMDFLNNEVNYIRKELVQTREELIKICEIMINLDKKVAEIPKTKEKPNPTHLYLNKTTPTHNPTHDLPLEALKSLNNAFSSGNEVVPTDRQTDRQTDNSEKKMPALRENNTPKSLNFNQNIKETPLNFNQNDKNNEKTEKNQDFSHLSHLIESPIDPIDGAAKILDSLDSIKKEIRLKFKRLTTQEMLVFSTLYQLEEMPGDVDYKVLAKRLNLTESSVRDYIGRLIKKGIPVEKKRVNNKTILLSVSSNLKRITSLSTIIQLRDL